MLSILRSVLVIIAGLVVAVVIISLFDAINSLVFPLPAGVDPMDSESLRAYAQTIPAGAFALLLLGWATGALTGAWVAGRLAGRAPLTHGLVVTVLLFIVGVMNMLLIPHPAWVWLLGIAAYLGCGYAGARLSARARAKAAA